MKNESISKRVALLIRRRDRANKNIHDGKMSYMGLYKTSAHEIRGILFALNSLGVKYWADCDNEFRISIIRIQG